MRPEDFLTLNAKNLETLAATTNAAQLGIVRSSENHGKVLLGLFELEQRKEEAKQQLELKRLESSMMRQLHREKYQADRDHATATLEETKKRNQQNFNASLVNAQTKLADDRVSDTVTGERILIESLDAEEAALNARASRLGWAALVDPRINSEQAELDKKRADTRAKKQEVANRVTKALEDRTRVREKAVENLSNAWKVETMRVDSPTTVGLPISVDDVDRLADPSLLAPPPEPDLPQPGDGGPVGSGLLQGAEPVAEAKIGVVVSGSPPILSGRLGVAGVAATGSADMAMPSVAPIAPLSPQRSPIELAMDEILVSPDFDTSGTYIGFDERGKSTGPVKLRATPGVTTPVSSPDNPVMRGIIKQMDLDDPEDAPVVADWNTPMLTPQDKAKMVEEKERTDAAIPLLGRDGGPVSRVIQGAVHARYPEIGVPVDNLKKLRAMADATPRGEDARAVAADAEEKMAMSAALRGATVSPLSAAQYLQELNVTHARLAEDVATSAVSGVDFQVPSEVAAARKALEATIADEVKNIQKAVAESVLPDVQKTALMSPFLRHYANGARTAFDQMAGTKPVNVPNIALAAVDEVYRPMVVDRTKGREYRNEADWRSSVAKEEQERAQQLKMRQAAIWAGPARQTPLAKVLIEQVDETIDRSPTPTPFGVPIVITGLDRAAQMDLRGNWTPGGRDAFMQDVRTSYADSGLLQMINHIKAVTGDSAAIETIKKNQKNYESLSIPLVIKINAQGLPDVNGQTAEVFQLGHTTAEGFQSAMGDMASADQGSAPSLTSIAADTRKSSTALLDRIIRAAVDKNPEQSKAARDAVLYMFSEMNAAYAETKLETLR